MYRAGSSLVIHAILLTWLGGCGDLADDTDPVVASAASEVYPVTAVYLSADGQHAVVHGTITRAQQLANREARAAHGASVAAGRAALGDSAESLSAAITQDYPCSYADVWLFSETNLTGFEICFYGEGSAYLPDWWWQDIPRSVQNANYCVRLQGTSQDTAPLGVTPWMIPYQDVYYADPNDVGRPYGKGYLDWAFSLTLRAPSTPATAPNWGCPSPLW